MTPSTFDCFEHVSQEEVKKVVSSSPTKSSTLDPIPSWMLKNSIDVLIPSVAKVVNSSLSSGIVPKSLKAAVISPIIKKPNLDRNILKNYRPVSNLPFLAKVLERVAVKQLTSYMNKHHLHESLQSAYKSFHSTETALLKVHNDILHTMDHQGVTILIMLDLSAAFDTIDHNRLLTRMEHELGIKGVPLKWFRSYLSERTQCVNIDGHSSPPTLMYWAVPQGSVLGPILFLIYMLPLGHIIRRHGLELHIYADDTQVYIAISPVSQLAVDDAVVKLEACLRDVQQWMDVNMLKLNASKTEIKVFGSRVQLAKFELPSITIGNETVPVQSDAVRNLGVLFDTNMQMGEQVRSLCRSCNFQLANLRKVRRLLTCDTAHLMVRNLVTTRLDYCNSLLFGISGELCKRLQLIQNSAARLVTGTAKHDHITRDLIKLHWLPIKQRIVYKIIVIAYKALHGMAPSYISDMLTEYTPRRSLRSASKSLLCEHKSNCVTFGGRAFEHSAPKLWNLLPNEVITSPSLDILKTRLKTHLFHVAYENQLN